MGTKYKKAKAMMRWKWKKKRIRSYDLKKMGAKLNNGKLNTVAEKDKNNKYK